jgi:hypothetical protein
MADGTKTKRTKRPSAGEEKKARSTGGAKPKGAGAKTKKAPSRKAQKPAAPSEAKAVEATEGLPVGAGANAALAGKAALEGARAAGKAMTITAAKIKVPLAVGGGLAAGAAGGLALMRRNGDRRRGAPDLGPVISAARRAGAIGEELGRMAALAEKAAASKGK